MKNNDNWYVPKFEQEKIDEVIKKLNPQKSKACNNNILFTAGQDSYSGNFYGHSLKRSNLKQCNFDSAVFDHTSFCGSLIDNVIFKNNCTFESVYFEQSILSNTVFESGLHIENCNFSNSELNKVYFESSELRGVYFDNCFLTDCQFKNCTIRATMFDNALLANCSLIECNMRNLNIEFATLVNCNLTGTTISFFQFPYIIGIFSDKNNIKECFLGRQGDITIPIKEYLDNIDESIIYFSGLSEYFPMANLYYAKGDEDTAYNCIFAGINKALLSNDIRMVENFCKLGQVYDLLSIHDLQKILKKVDSVIEQERENPLYGLLLSKTYHLKSAITQNNTKSKLQIVLNTNIDGDNFDIVSRFCADIDNIISSILPNKITTTYQLSHNSPFEICLMCVGFTADLIAIAGPIYQFISQKMKNTKMSPAIQTYIKNSNEEYIKSLNNQFDMLETSLKHTKKSEYDGMIKDFRGKIITSVTEHINKDLALLVSQCSD